VVDPSDVPVKAVRSYVDLPPSLQNLAEGSTKKEKKASSIEIALISDCGSKRDTSEA
jgi:hypothetical protein